MLKICSGGTLLHLSSMRHGMLCEASPIFLVNYKSGVHSPAAAAENNWEGMGCKLLIRRTCLGRQGRQSSDGQPAQQQQRSVHLVDRAHSVPEPGHWCTVSSPTNSEDSCTTSSPFSATGVNGKSRRASGGFNLPGLTLPKLSFPKLRLGRSNSSAVTTEQAASHSQAAGHAPTHAARRNSSTASNMSSGGCLRPPILRLTAQYHGFRCSDIMAIRTTRHETHVDTHYSQSKPGTCEASVTAEAFPAQP